MDATLSNVVGMFRWENIVTLFFLSVPIVTAYTSLRAVIKAVRAKEKPSQYWFYILIFVLAVLFALYYYERYCLN